MDTSPFIKAQYDEFFYLFGLPRLAKDKSRNDGKVDCFGDSMNRRSNYKAIHNVKSTPTLLRVVFCFPFLAHRLGFEMAKIRALGYLSGLLRCLLRVKFPFVAIAKCL